MKFKLINLNSTNGRLGCISEIERFPSFQLETPNLLFYTKGGCIPHLTHEVMLMLTTKILPLQFPLSNYFHNCECIIKSNTSLCSFVGLPEYISYCCTHDPTLNIPQKFHRGKTATIWSLNGKDYLSAEKYMSLMESFQPDMYVSMSDGDTDQQCSMKRTCNAAIITNDAMQYCYSKHIASPILKNKGFIAAIEGGYNLDIRERCAKFMADFPVVGYLINGLYSNGKEVCDLPFQPVERILQHTLKFLPEERLRIVHGAWEPLSVLKMVKLGIDLFDTSLPYTLSEKGSALVFSYDIDNILYDDTETIRNCKSSSKNEEITEEVNEKIIKDNYSISLLDKKYFDDLGSLVQNCVCLTCRKHTRAYIHHLLCAKELLAYVLLMIHNLHHYMEFFDQIRKSIRQNCKQTSASINGAVS